MFAAIAPHGKISNKRPAGRLKVVRAFCPGGVNGVGTMALQPVFRIAMSLFVNDGTRAAQWLHAARRPSVIQPGRPVVTPALLPDNSTGGALKIDAFVQPSESLRHRGALCHSGLTDAPSTQSFLANLVFFFLGARVKLHLFR